MPVNAPTPYELQEALRPLRTDPSAFEQGVRDRIDDAEEHAAQSVDASSALLRTAAAFLPLPILGGKALLAGAKPIGPGYKMLGFLALPAVSIFLVLGTFVFSAWRIRKTKTSEARAGEAPRALRAWWNRHWWLLPFFVAGPFVFLFVPSYLVFALLVLSFLALTVLLTSLSRAGLATRSEIAGVCGFGMMFVAMPVLMGRSDSLSLLGSDLPVAVLFVGAIVLAWLGGPSRVTATGVRTGGRWVILILLPVAVMNLASVLRPATPARMQDYVESLDKARFHSATWHQWEVAATWLNDTQREVDWTIPRALFLKEEMAGKQNSFVLGVAARVGLLRPEDFEDLRDLTSKREHLLSTRRAADSILSIKQHDWVVRALAAKGVLTPADRDLLAQRLHATWAALHKRASFRLSEALVVTELYDVIERPFDLESRRNDVHAWLRTAYETKTGPKLNGGFYAYEGGPTDAMATWAAVRLMERFGIPTGIDPLTVRSAARPKQLFWEPDWIAAATRWKLDRVPGNKPPTWIDYLVHERTLIACILLVLLALYATLRAPRAGRALARI